MAFNTGLSECCCPSDACEVLSNICRVTVSFVPYASSTSVYHPDAFVKQPEVSGDNDDDVPPHIHSVGNPASNAGICSANSQRGDCTKWNRANQFEWEVFPVQPLGGLPSEDTIVLITLAAGQAGPQSPGDGGGFSIQPDVYRAEPLGVSPPRAQAGSVCFPCAEAYDNEGLELVLSCQKGVVGATLRLYTPGGNDPTEACPITEWVWDSFVPVPYTATDEGVEHPANRITDLNYTPDFQSVLNAKDIFNCYRPAGHCENDVGSFPFCRDEDTEDLDPDKVASFYDTHNCWWDGNRMPVLRLYTCDAEPPAIHPMACDPCVGEDDHVLHGDFAADGGGTEQAFAGQGADYVEANYWLLTENNGQPGTVTTEASGDVELTFPCWYDLFIRYRFSEADEDDAEVRVFNVDGAGGAFVGDIDEFWFLPASTDLDGNQNTHIIDNKRYRKLGTIQMHDPDDTFVRVEVDGPSRDGHSLEFDDFVFQRL